MRITNSKLPLYLCLAVALPYLIGCSDSNSSAPDPSEISSDDQPTQQGTQTQGTQTEDTQTQNTQAQDTQSDPNLTELEQPEVIETLAFPTYAGVLDVSNGVDYDISNLLELYQLDRIDIASLASDGSSILLTGRNFESDLDNYLLLDSATGETTELVGQVAPNTRTLFDKNNNLIAVSAGDCETPSYETDLPVALFLSDLVPAGRCMSHIQDFTLSDNANVVLFYTYEQNFTTEYAYQTNQLHAYTLDTATLITWQDPVMTPQQTLVGSRGGAIPNRLSWVFSQDGRTLYTPIWWEGQNGDVTERYVGAVLWNTSTGDIQERAVTQDNRGCTVTSKVSCTPPYSYVMSDDGNVQYSQIPTDTLANTGSPFTSFVTDTVRTETNAPANITISALQSGTSLATNLNGSHVYFNDNQQDESTLGNALYQRSSGATVSIDPALRECSIDPITGQGDTSELACKYRESPFTIENNAMSFSANGKTLLMRSMSRFTPDFETQSVKGFMLDIDTGKLIEMAPGYSVHQNRISADAKTLLGRSTSFPYNVLTLVTRP